MVHISILRTLPLWKDRDLKITELHGGRTNFNYLVLVSGKKYIARFAPFSVSRLGINKAREIHNTKIAARLNVGPKPVRFYPEYNLVINEYIPGIILSKSKSRSPQNLRLVARMLRKIHNGPKLKGSWDPFAQIKKDLAASKVRKSWMTFDQGLLLARLQRIKKSLKPLSTPKPSHTDLVLNNLIKKQNSIKLIDWEYAANSDYRYDLAMFSALAGLNKKQDKLFLENYGDLKLYNDLQLMKPVVYLREAAWSMLQLSISNVDFNYKKYALENLLEFSKQYRRLGKLRLIN